jgi:hypothetical protein
LKPGPTHYSQLFPLKSPPSFQREGKREIEGGDDWTRFYFRGEVVKAREKEREGERRREES